MSIKSTQNISRETAIERIQTVVNLINKKLYVDLQNISYEVNYDIKKFVDSGIDFDINNIENWTNTMLEEIMDKPFFRFSLFDNYIVDGESKSETISLPSMKDEIVKSVNNMLLKDRRICAINFNLENATKSAIIKSALADEDIAEYVLQF